ncbi:hypothetical protein MKX03_028489 [Papaver bracteatum]|nr:hypothetical protein MKX03_028489 [Papaver bracteatum]
MEYLLLCKHGAKVWTEEELPAGLIRERLPKHVGVMMDGNRRWAKYEEELISLLGPDGSFSKLNIVTELSCKWGIKVLTAFIFSTQNWIRPQHEVDFYMKAIELCFLSIKDVYVKSNVRVSVIGDLSKVPIPLQKVMTEIIEMTKNNTGLHLNIGLNYGGREDIIKACTSISRRVKNNLIEPEEIDAKMFDQELETKSIEFPHPDLIIRTSGEKRISNFLLWQLAYSELHFEDCLWPDFGEKEFIKALRSFQERRRRFGGDSEEGLGEELYKQAIASMNEYGKQLLSSSN